MARKRLPTRRAATIPSAPLLGLENIGRTIAARLLEVGVRTVGDLRRVGPARVYKRLAAARPGETTSVCYYLYSLQGALDGVHWDALGSDVKQQLLRDAGLPALNRRSQRPARSRRR